MLRKRLKGALALVVLSGVASLASAQEKGQHGTQAAPAQPAALQPAKPDTTKGRTIATQVCAACHGADGNSPAAVNPKLAGQVPEYIVKQLVSFKANSERKNAIMAGMAAPLSDDDMRSLGAFFSEQKAMQGTARDKEAVALGRKLWRGGDVARGLPACAGCHGATGAGIPAQYPRLAGQHAEYTEAQLKLFRSEERSNDPNGMMRTIAAKLTDREIRAVSDFIAGVR
jgi:cytochrome c553